MKKILVPIDGSERSQKSLDFVLSKYPKDKFSITLMSVNDVSLTNITNPMLIDVKMRESQKKVDCLLESLKDKLAEYEVETYTVFGDPGPEIIKKSVDDDFDLIMVNKPPFMVVHPTKSHVDNTIANGVTDYITKKGEKVKIRFVNRLDMNTSGLVIVAKNAYAHHTLSTDMSNNKVEKKYITIVKGILENDFGTIDEPIYRQEEDSIKRIVDERGQRSVTHYKVLQRLNDATVLEVKLETGRTHQIRVHMNYIGHGIIGDELYGYVDESLINRQALHAYSLEFSQPRTKENLSFIAEIPDDMKKLIEKLK
ncbi:RluA family pseudouridine synthase [Paeniclostridium sordellii]|uniref:RluA family pseudouridine synthase n=1 Tax=Paraclostridium sordellii TaxID=1505 RepID=UPI0012ED7417|nr:RluA family pseudouridine synthase [Paeniclostridium sordellii]MVO74836.1 RluA family pseudouridine synthase [Paeniclostridium sordellii]